MNGVDLSNLPIGTQVRVVDKWRKDSESGMQNSMGEMDKFLGGTFSIIKKHTYDSFFYLDIEDAGYEAWLWSIELIDSFKLPDSDIWHKINYIEDFNTYIVDVLPEEVIPIKETESKYMVYVSGKASPKKVHNTYESACQEAERLAGKEVGYVVSICRVEKQFIGKIIVEEVV